MQLSSNFLLNIAWFIDSTMPSTVLYMLNTVKIKSKYSMFQTIVIVLTDHSRPVRTRNGPKTSGRLCFGAPVVNTRAEYLAQSTRESRFVRLNYALPHSNLQTCGTSSEGVSADVCTEISSPRHAWCKRLDTTELSNHLTFGRLKPTFSIAASHVIGWEASNELLLDQHTSPGFKDRPISHL
jgi:hypothetical protein